MGDFDICYMSLFDMAQAIRRKEVSPVELVDTVIQRIERLNPRVNAFCTPTFDYARQKAREAENAIIEKKDLGLLHGVPVSIKDLIFTKGIRTTGGSMIFENFIPEENDVVVERLESAGAIIIGKTNTSEFGWAAITHNRLFGPTLNPWKLSLSPGGSSGGAAAAVALGMGPLAIGSDGGGSIRIPASFCGVCGFKPSYGRVPVGPGFPGWETVAHVGPITRNVRDAAFAMEVIAGRDDRDIFSLPERHQKYRDYLNFNLKRCKIAWVPDLGYTRIESMVAAICNQAARIFDSLGAAIEEVNPHLPSPESAFSVHVGTRLSALLEDYMGEWGDKIDPLLALFIQANKSRTAREYLESRWEMLKWYGEINRVIFEKYDYMLTPTVAVLPFTSGGYGPREIEGRKVSPLAWMAFTYPFNMTGHPAVSIPCGWDMQGLPVGLQIIGHRFDDKGVLGVAAAYEEACPWNNKYQIISNVI